jgi:phosphoglucomutase
MCAYIGVAPIVDLDDKVYKMIQNLDACVSGGYPSLVGCRKLTVKGRVHLSRQHVFRGTVTIINSSAEPKFLPPGVYADTTVDLSSAPGLGALRPYTVPTAPFDDQKPGTSGLRKKTAKFMDVENHYLHNFVQATFTALAETGTDVSSGSLLIGGDGRYFNAEAIQIIVKVAVANGVRRLVIGQNGLLSTPAVSAIIRERGPVFQKCFGAFILTASHNPGGPHEDFGIKYNCENGGPAPEKLTDKIYEVTRTLTSFNSCNDFPIVNISDEGSRIVTAADGSKSVVIEVISSTEAHVKLLQSVFDFDAIRRLFSRSDFSFRYDCMHGVQGPYAREVFVNTLGASPSCLMNAVPRDDFAGHHADPNLTYARDLCDVMGVNTQGAACASVLEHGHSHDESSGGEKEHAAVPCIGVASDGDADRNMILGRHFFVTPSDSLAILAAHADVIPYFRLQGGLKSVARSMPTSGAVDLVAKRLNLNLYETPTGWKYFGNVMDSKVMNVIAAVLYCAELIF